jgi:hypothetical protein
MEAPQNRKILWKDGVPPVPSAHLNRVRGGGLGVYYVGEFLFVTKFHSFVISLGKNLGNMFLAINCV